MGNGRSDLVDIAAEKRGETEKAYHLYDGTKTEWVPKSQVEDNGDGTWAMPEWLAKEKGVHLMGKPILCVDFDGVVHSYTSGWKGATVIPDPPVDGALRWLWKATEWWDVQIYSSRSKDPEARVAMETWMRLHSVNEFDDDHPMISGDPYPITFAYEKPSAFLTIDDRAVCFEGDWAEFDPCAMLDFKPWNKRR